MHFFKYKWKTYLGRYGDPYIPTLLFYNLVVVKHDFVPCHSSYLSFYFLHGRNYCGKMIRHLTYCRIQGLSLTWICQWRKKNTHILKCRNTIHKESDYGKIVCRPIPTLRHCDADYYIYSYRCILTTCKELKYVAK